jgi:hypothetical protein
MNTFKEGDYVILNEFGRRTLIWSEAVLLEYSGIRQVKLNKAKELVVFRNNINHLDANTGYFDPAVIDFEYEEIG